MPAPDRARHQADPVRDAGAGAAAIACAELIKAMGVPHDNLLMSTAPA
jgi:malic enzyme